MKKDLFHHGEIAISPKLQSLETPFYRQMKANASLANCLNAHKSKCVFMEQIDKSKIKRIMLILNGSPKSVAVVFLQQFYLKIAKSVRSLKK